MPQQIVIRPAVKSVNAVSANGKFTRLELLSSRASRCVQVPAECEETTAALWLEWSPAVCEASAAARPNDGRRRSYLAGSSTTVVLQSASVAWYQCCCLHFCGSQFLSAAISF